MSVVSEAATSSSVYTTKEPMQRVPPAIPPRARGRPPPPLPSPTLSAPEQLKEAEPIDKEGRSGRSSPRPETFSAQRPSVDKLPQSAHREHHADCASSGSRLETVPVPLPTRNNSSVSSLSASSSRNLPQAKEVNTSSSTSTLETCAPELGTPESDYLASRLDVTDDLETFGRKMSYALQVDAPLISQRPRSPPAIDPPVVSSPVVEAGSRRGSGNESGHATDSIPHWTPPGRISRPSAVSPSSPRQQSPESSKSSRLQSTGSYLTRRQQQANDLRSEVDEENRKRRERRTVIVKDGYKIVDGVRAKASSSGVYTPSTFSAVPPTGRSTSGSSVYTPATLSPSSTSGLATPNGYEGFSAGPSVTSPGAAPLTGRSRGSFPSPGLLSPLLTSMSFSSTQSSEPAGPGSKSREFFPPSLSRKKSSGLASGESGHNRLVGSAITGMRSISLGIEHWRKQSVTSQTATTEYDDLLRKEEMERPPPPPARNSITVERFERHASLSAMEVLDPRSPRRQSEPSQQNSRSGFTMSAENEPVNTATHSTMGAKNVKGLRLPLSDMPAFTTVPSLVDVMPSSSSPRKGDIPPDIASMEPTVPEPGLLSPAIINTTTIEPAPVGASPTLSLPSATTPPSNMGEATRGTRRKPVPLAFATKVRSDSTAATSVSPAA
ncbi:hypothetical protein NliqN6_3164 [Naganishia liquefaciens]|uniref:Uncharacterized protein n=1 Tax=Naganishia liquefaciens TaxID=104408 RepID=A0A8H3TT81_9TREE|nr:hypothetical protein NliqN6_3164 [Naganishia liquefaciens]